MTDISLPLYPKESCINFHARDIFEMSTGMSVDILRMSAGMNDASTNTHIKDTHASLSY